MINPILIPQPFAANGNKNTIKNIRETGQSPEDATWADGFPPVTMTPIEAGGLPPKGLDFNGIFYALSDNTVYQAKGGRYHFDAAFANAIGGYQKGAILMSADDTKEFICTVANNKNNPNTNMTGWALYAGAGLIVDASTTQKGITQLNDTLTSNSVSQAATANAVKQMNEKMVDIAGAQTITGMKTFNAKQVFSSAELAGYASWKNTISMTGDLPAIVADNLGIGFYKSENTLYFIDFVAKTYGCRINHSTGLVDLNGKNSDLLIHGVSVKTAINDAIKKQNFVVMAGTVAHGGTIPLPSGFTADKCTWFVSSADINPNDTVYAPQAGSNKQWRLNCSVNESRVVTAIMTVWNTNASATTIPCNANYIIIGAK